MMPGFANVAAAPQREISNVSRKFPAARVLVVDGERLVRWAVAETLGDHGFEVVEAADAESARQAITAPAARPDLVLLDLRLPDCDDLCMVAFIRAHTPATPIVVMTEDATPEMIDEAIHLGAAVVSKPFDMNELAALVERAVAPRAS
jgi:DNA-binding NtrC family response regulator